MRKTSKKNWNEEEDGGLMMPGLELIPTKKIKETIELYDHVEVYYPRTKLWVKDWFVVEILPDGYMCCNHWYGQSSNPTDTKYKKSGQPYKCLFFSKTDSLRYFTKDRVRPSMYEPKPLQPVGLYKSHTEYLIFCGKRVGGYDSSDMSGGSPDFVMHW